MVRHAQAGYPTAKAVAEGRGPLTKEAIKVPLWWSPKATFGPQEGTKTAGEPTLVKRIDSPPQPRADLLISGAVEILTCRPKGGDLIGRIRGGSVAIAGERILAIGPDREVASQVDITDAQVVDARGKIVAPGFVDCHTHLIFGGSRVKEYALQ